MDVERKLKGLCPGCLLNVLFSSFTFLFQSQVFFLLILNLYFTGVNKGLTLLRPMPLSYRKQSIICRANQLTGFYMRGTLDVKGLARFSGH